MLIISFGIIYIGRKPSNPAIIEISKRTTITNIAQASLDICGFPL
ncbi:hypothetical protein [Methanobrevibacter sp.]|nr:hypothetical protein [Methanobrevibacter sp.]